MITRTEPIGRRRFLGAGIGLVAGTAGLDLFRPSACPAGLHTDALIAGIERDVIFPGRQGDVSWFHPRPCMISTADGPEALADPGVLNLDEA